MKKILALLLLLAMGLAMTACERSDVVAVVEGKEIHLPEAKEVYDFYIKQQIDIAMYYGIQITPDYPGYKDFIASMKTGTLNMMVENIAKELMLSNANLALTQEELAQIEATANEEYNGLIEGNTSVSEDAGEEAKAAARALAQARAEEAGYSLDALRYLIHYDTVTQKLRDKIAESVVLHEADVETKYDALVAEQMEAYAVSPTQFEQDLLYYGKTIYAYPEGYRFVKNIVLELPEEVAARIAEKSGELSAANSSVTSALEALGAESAPGGEEKTALEARLAEYKAQAAALTNEIEALRQQGLEEIREHAEEVLALCKAEGADFDAILAEYSVDQPSLPFLAAHGYPVSARSSAYVQPFTDGAMALEHIGDVSGLIASQFGYHILLYAEDARPGAVPLADVIDTVTEQALADKEDAAYKEYVSHYLGKYDIKVYTSRFKVD
ncbi:MAG: peptidylprolyl isomerase [Firmicutes bacterium]|nr:peptidylprolyl isomerase [Bacillota bacterium]